jgi:hypothetical protein
MRRKCKRGHLSGSHSSRGVRLDIVRDIRGEMHYRGFNETKTFRACKYVYPDYILVNRPHPISLCSSIKGAVFYHCLLLALAQVRPKMDDSWTWTFLRQMAMLPNDGPEQTAENYNSSQTWTEKSK